jgi:hypothetical protein
LPVIVNMLFTVPLSLDDNIRVPLLFGVLLSSQLLNHANWLLPLWSKISMYRKVTDAIVELLY